VSADSSFSGSLIPTPASAIRRATSGWFRPDGTATTGTPLATALAGDPRPAGAHHRGGPLLHGAVGDEPLDPELWQVR
jgi:hypothetical protein